MDSLQRLDKLSWAWLVHHVMQDSLIVDQLGGRRCKDCMGSPIFVIVIWNRVDKAEQ